MERSSFGTAPGGQPVDVYTLTNAAGDRGACHQLRRHHHLVCTSRTATAASTTSCWATTRSRAIWRTPRTSARSSAAMATASPGAASRSTAGRTRWRQQRGEPPARRAQGLRQGGVDGGAASRTTDGHRPRARLRQPRRRGGLSRARWTARVTYTLTDRQRARLRLPRHDGQADAGQSHAAQLLQPRGRRAAATSCGHVRRRQRRPLHAG